MVEDLEIILQKGVVSGARAELLEIVWQSRHSYMRVEQCSAEQTVSQVLGEVPMRLEAVLINLGKMTGLENSYHVCQESIPTQWCETG
jgi:hypothetical protein